MIEYNLEYDYISPAAEYLKKNGYVVETPFVDIETAWDILWWVRENVHGRHTNTATYADSKRREKYFFEDSDDAMRFKMRWG